MPGRSPRIALLEPGGPRGRRALLCCIVDQLPFPMEVCVRIRSVVTSLLVGLTMLAIGAGSAFAQTKPAPSAGGSSSGLDLSANYVLAHVSGVNYPAGFAV